MLLSKLVVELARLSRLALGGMDPFLGSRDLGLDSP
jgi:hypothetical protein